MTTPQDISKSHGTLRQVPDLDALFRTWGLYDRIGSWNDILGGLKAWLAWLVYVGGSVDLYCPNCKSLSVFTRPPTGGTAQQVLKIDYAFPVPTDHEFNLPVDFFCARSPTHVARLFLLTEPGNYLTKMGQWPSVADVSERSLDVYKKVLGEARTKELKRAVGLFSHGIGAGALIYLRRILEFFVSRAESQFKAANGKLPYADIERVREKIKALAEFLPPFIADNRKLYGMMSDGLHNGTEEDCKTIFSPCLEGLKIALDEMEAERLKKERSAAAALALERAQRALPSLRDAEAVIAELESLPEMSDENAKRNS